MRERLRELVERLRGEGVGAVLARGASIFLVVQVAGAAITFAAQVALARAMGAGPYGQYVYTLNWLLLLLLLSRLGFGTASLRFVAQYVATEDWPRLRGYLRTADRIVWSASLLLCLLGLGGVAAFGHRLEPALRDTFLVACLGFPIYVSLQVGANVLRGFKRVLAAQAPSEILSPLLLGAGALAFWLGGPGRLDAAGAMALTLAAVAVAVLVTRLVLHRTVPDPVRAAPPRTETRQWLRVALPILLVNTVHVSMQRADVLMVGSLLGAEDAAVYASANRIALLVPFGLTAVNAWAAPLISDLHARGDLAGLQRLVRLAALGILGVTVPAILLVVALGHQLLGLFGEEFTRAYWPLVILAGGQLVNALVGPVGFLMTMTGLQDTAARILGIHAVANVVLLALLVPRFGILGAAAATSVVRASWNLILMGVVWRRLGVRSLPM